MWKVSGKVRVLPSAHCMVLHMRARVKGGLATEGTCQVRKEPKASSVAPKRQSRGKSEKKMTASGWAFRGEPKRSTAVSIAEKKQVYMAVGEDQLVEVVRAEE
jgi:hypothetical protein